MQGIAAEQQRGRSITGPLVTPTTHHGGATQLLQQGHGPIGRRQGDLGGQALFKAAAGIGAQADAAGTAAHRLGGEDGRLQPDGRGAVGHGAVGAPDHPGQGDRGLGVGDDQGLFIELVPTAIEGPEGLAAAGLAEADGPNAGARIASLRWPQAGQTGRIKGVQGLAGFQHHQIGDVDHRIDRPQTGTLQTALQPARRRADLDPREGREAEEAASFHGGKDVCLQGQGLGGEGRIGWRQGQGRPGQGCHFPGNAPHREAIGPVGGNRQLQHLIVQAQTGTHRGSHPRHGLEQLVEDGDAVGTVS